MVKGPLDMAAPRAGACWTAEERRALRRMLRAGAAQKVIAARLGRSVAAVHSQIGVLRAAGILRPIRRGWTAAEDAALVAALAAGRSHGEIAAETGRSVPSIRHRVARLRADGSGAVVRRGSGPKHIDWSLLPDLWARPAIPTEAIARAVGVTASAVRQVARAMGLPPRPHSSARRKRIVDAEFARMWAFGVSVAEIARAFGVARGTVACRRAALGLPPRARMGGGHAGWGSQTLAAWREWEIGQRMRQAA